MLVSGISDTLEIVTYLVDASERVEGSGGTTHVAPDRATWLLI